MTTITKHPPGATHKAPLRSSRSRRMAKLGDIRIALVLILPAMIGLVAF